MPPGGLHNGVVYLDELLALDLRGAQIGVDFVHFTDGTSWGNNVSGEKEVNIGHEIGQRDAVQAVRKVAGDQAALSKLLNRNEVERVIIERCQIEKPKSCEGYRFGYGLTAGTLRIALQLRKMAGLLEKLVEIERTFTAS